MHLVTIYSGTERHPGVKLNDRVVDITIAARAMDMTARMPASVREIIASGDTVLNDLRDMIDRVSTDSKLALSLEAAGGLSELAAVRHAAPLPNPRLIMSCGRNSRLHFAELAQATAPATPSEPAGFLKNPGSVIGPGEAIILPERFPDMVDWEAEFCAVIGKECHDVTSADAPAYVAGYTMINDVSARNFIPAPDAEGKRKMNIEQNEKNLLGKQFPTFCPMGPAIVTADEIADPGDINFSLSVNGQTMQQGNTGDVYFSLMELIAYYSTFYTFRPGDIVTIGTPAGTGFGRSPQVFLKHGDVVEIDCDVLGAFTNPIVSGAL